MDGHMLPGGGSFIIFPLNWMRCIPGWIMGSGDMCQTCVHLRFRVFVCVCGCLSMPERKLFVKKKINTFVAQLCLQGVFYFGCVLVPVLGG